MNKGLSTLLFFLCFALTSFGQQPADHVNRGALGFVKIGLGFGAPDDLNNDLSNSFGQSASISSSSIQMGAGGFMLFSKRLLLGAEGFGLFHSTEEVGQYSARLTGGGGGLKVGFALLNNNTFLGFPYIGLGLGGNRVEIKNDADEAILFGETTVPEYFEERLRARYPILDLGISIFKIPHPDTDGLSIGGHIGYRTSLGQEPWEMDNGDNVIGAKEMSLSTFYIKLSIGGGGFFHKRKKNTENP